MTKVEAPVSSRKPARFAGNWLAGSAESRSARRRLNAILRLACMVLGFKRRKGLGMMAAALVVSLASPVLAQSVTASSPAVGVAGVPAGFVRLENGFGFEAQAINHSGLSFTALKGTVVTSPNGVVKADGVVVPLNVPLDKDYFFPASLGEFYKGTFFKGPVVMAASDTSFPLRFPVGTVFPIGTIFPSGGVPKTVVLGVPTTEEFVTPQVAGMGNSIRFPKPIALSAIPETRFPQIKINTDANSQPATTSTTVLGDIAIGTNAGAKGGTTTVVVPAAVDATAPAAATSTPTTTGATAPAATGAAVPAVAGAAAPTVTTITVPAIAIGDNAKAAGAGGTAVGPNSNAGVGGSAFGSGSDASGLNSSALGWAAKASKDSAIAIGNASEAQGLNAGAFGPGAKSSGNYSLALGNASEAAGYNAGAIGSGSKALGWGSTAIGWSASAGAEHGTAIGILASSGGASSAAVGSGAKSDGQFSIALGNASEAAGYNAGAIGSGSKALGYGSTAIGWSASTSATATSSTAIGKKAKSDGEYSVAIGASSEANQLRATAIGTDTKATEEASTAIGWEAKSTKKKSTAIGPQAKSDGESSIAIGDTSGANNSKAIAIGTSSQASEEYAIAVGASSKANKKNSVALGSNAETEDVHKVDSVTLNGKDYAFDSTKATAVVSVGKADVKRQIINVAPGQVSATSTDAVNGSQLNAAYDGINRLGNSAVQYSVSKDAAGNETVDYTKLQLKGSNGTKISNVAEGTADTDAVNKGQFNKVVEKATEAKMTADAAKVGADAATTKLAGLSDDTVQKSIDASAKKLGETVDQSVKTVTGNLATVKTTADAAKVGADAATTKLAGLSDDTVQKSIDASAKKLGETVDQSVKTVTGNLATVKTTADAAKVGADAATTKLAGLSDDTVQKSIDASAKKLGDTVDQSVKTVTGNLATVKTTADAAKVGADAATTKLAGLSDATVQGSINTAATKVGQSVAKALGEGTTLDKDGKLVLPDFGLTSLGKDATGKDIAQPVTMLGGLKAIDGVVKSQGERLVTTEGTVKDQGTRLTAAEGTVKAQGDSLVTQGGQIGTLQKDALLYDNNAGAYSASHGKDKTSRIGNVAAGVSDTDAVNKSQLDTLQHALNSGSTGLVQTGDGGNTLAIGGDSTAKVLDLGGKTPKLDDEGKVVRDADGKPILVDADRRVTGVGDGIANNDAVNKGQLDVVKTTADAAKVGADAATTKLAGLSDATVQGSINTAATKVGQSVAKALGEGTTLDKDGKLVLPDFGLTSLGKDATGKDIAQPVTMLGGLKAIDGIVKSQGDRLVTAEGTLKTQGETLAGQGKQIGTLQQDALLFDGTTYNANHGGTKSRISNVAEGTADTDAVNKSQLNKVDQKLADLSKGTSGVIKEDKDSGVITIGSGSDAAKVDLGHQVGKVDDKGNPVLGTDGKQLLETKDRVLTGVADGVVNATSTEAVNGKQLHKLDKRAVKYAWKDKNGNGILDDDEIQMDTIEFGQPSVAGGISGMTTLKNVAGGLIAENSHDAINGGQFYSLANSMAQTFGGGVQVMNGIISAPHFLVYDFHSEWSEYIKSSGSDGEKKYIGFGYRDNVVNSVGDAINEINKNSATFDLRIQANHERLNVLYDTALRLDNSQAAYNASPDKYNAEAHHRKLLEEVEAQKNGFSSAQNISDANSVPSHSTGRSGAASIITPVTNEDSVAGNQTTVEVQDMIPPQNSTAAPVATGSPETSLPVAKKDNKIVALANGVVEQGSQDAVNGGQLHAVDAKVDKLSDRAVTYATVGDAKANTVKLQGGDPSMPVVISNLSAGTNDLDAVNVKQLKGQADEIATKSQQAAKSYSDEVGDKSVAKANSYSDDAAAKSKLAAKSYTDNAKKEAIDTANTYTDEIIGGTDGQGGVRGDLAKMETKMANGFNHLSSEISSVRSEARQAAAIGLAASSLRFDSRPGKVSVAVGGGMWRDQGAFAFGAGYTSETGKVRANITGVTSGGEVGVGAGLSFTLN